MNEEDFLNSLTKKNYLKNLKEYNNELNNMGLDKCKICKRTLDIRTVQTRKADEGMTYFYTCTSCKTTTRR